MLDVFDALDLADHDNGLVLLRKDYVENEISVEEFERAVEARLEELQHSDEIHTDMARKNLQSAMHLEVRKLAEQKLKKRTRAADQILSSLYCGPVS